MVKRILWPKLIVLSLFIFSGGTLHSKILYKNASFAEQVNKENEVYEIKHTFDLQGETISLPKGCTLFFRCGGCLTNGTIKGENVTIRLRDRCLSHISVEGGIKANKSVIKSSCFKEWDGNSLSSLCAMCPNGGLIELNALFDYTQEKTITPDGAITIEGKGKTVRTINPTSENFCPTFLDAKDVVKVEIRSLKIDGGWKNKSLLGGTDPNRWFIKTQNVDNVIIENCMFMDLKTSFGNWREVEDALMLFKDFHRAVFKNNTIVGCKAPEGPLFRHEPDNSEDIVILENNRFEYTSVSSNVNIYFCRFKIVNNYFGFCRGSGINAFGHDGQIIGNEIIGSYNSAGIDVSEYGDMNYTSKNIEVKGNKCGLCYGGFFAGHDIRNITIADNYYDAGQYDAKAFAFYDTPQKQREPVNDRMLYLGGNVSDITVRNNTFKGGHSLLCQWDDAQRGNILIDGNIVMVADKPVRSMISLSAVDGLAIVNNKFTGTGKTFGSLGYPSFICTQPLPKGSQRVFGDVEISGNEFTITSTTDSCYVFAHTIYDKRQYHGMAILGNISIHDNKCNKAANVLLNTGDFSSNTSPKVEVKNNEFRGGRVMGNVSGVTRNGRENAGMLKRNATLTHDVVIRDGNDYYYVICGGVTAKNKSMRIEKDGLIYDGEAVLQKVMIKE